MALLFVDGFDAGDVAAKWAITLGSWIHNTSTRYSVGGAAQSSGGGAAFKLFAPSAQVFVGTAYKRSLGSIASILQFYADNGSRLHILLRWSTDGSLYIERSGGGTLASTPPGTVPLNTWCYIECAVTLADAGGTVVVKVNGAQLINFSGDTRNAGTSTNIDGIQIGGDTQSYYDDLYVCNSLGSAPYNTYLGDIRINTIVPNGAGASSAFTPSAGANYQAVDELPYTSTDYVSATPSGTYDSYTMSDLSGSYTVLAVQTNVVAKKLDAGGTALRPAIRSGATTYYGTSAILNTNDITISDLRTVDPATSATWTIAGVNGMEAGMEIV